jgi:di/tricarboxylate transporter
LAKSLAYFFITVLIVLPIVSFLLIKNLNLDSREANDENKKEVEIKQWKRREVIKDYRFYIISSNMLAMPWIFTGFAVFQSFVQTSKGWGPLCNCSIIYVLFNFFSTYFIFIRFFN